MPTTKLLIDMKKNFELYFFGPFLSFFIIFCAVIFHLCETRVHSSESVSSFGIFITEHEMMSANLRDANLREVLREIEKQHKVRFKGDEALYQNKISVQFDNLPLQDGLKRILSSMNYSLVFGPNDKLVGVVIISKGTSQPTSSRGTAGSRRKNILSPPKSTSSSKPASRVSRKSGQKKSYITSRPPSKATTETNKMFQAKKNVTPPGGRVNPSPEQLEKFKVKKNVPPPGGPGKITPEERKNFKVKKNVPPPGGPGKITPKKLENFKVIKNVPPPGS